MLRLFFILLYLYATLSAGDRCQSYVQEVRRAHYQVFGLNYPYWYGVGQLRQESNCRDVISRDGVGSQGVAQITYRIWKSYLTRKGVPDIISTSNQLRAQALIMANCKKQAYSSHLWVAYQVYNGGSLVNREIKAARKETRLIEIPHRLARLYCKRRDIVFNNGQTINACDINYEYSEYIYKYAQKYKLFSDTNYIFW
jgi:hypothetical protein